MAVIELNGNEWQDFVQADYAVLDCYGDECFACVLLAPVLDAVADELSGVRFGRINVTTYTEVMEKFGIDSLPTVLCFRRGELVHTTGGSMSREELLGELAALLYR